MPTITRLTGVYDADGGVRGELAYAIGKVRGTAHCALCDITHRTVRMRPQWRGFTAGLGVPFDLVHRDERSPEVRRASEGRLPCVLAHNADGLQVLLGPAELDRLHGDVAATAEALHAAAGAAGLTWPAAGGPS